MGNDFVLIIVIWLLILTFAIVYLVIDNHRQHSINDYIDDTLEMLIDDLNR